MNRKIIALVLCIWIAVVLSNCSFPHPAPTVLSQEDAANTAAAQTVEALSTEISTLRIPTATQTSNATSTASSPLSAVLGLGATPGTDTPQPASPGSQISGLEITPEPNAPCNRAHFVSDVTIPDGSTFPPATRFTKTWEIQNTGSCPWTPEYKVAYAGGDQMGGKDGEPLINSGQVKPGQSVTVSVSLVAPGENGEYKGSWWLSAADGTTFGIGDEAAGTFYVDIKVDEIFSFAEQICSADWSTSAGKIPCPVQGPSENGFMQLLTDPTLETGKKETGLGILAVPQQVTGGYIVGRYPPVTVPSQADFRAVIGCDPETKGCFVKFKITYQVDNGAEQPLSEWNEGFDNNTTQAIADLNSLSGKSVAFNLYVYVNGAPDASKGIWFNPIITK